MAAAIATPAYLRPLSSPFPPNFTCVAPGVLQAEEHISVALLFTAAMLFDLLELFVIDTGDV
jgi:hypothetical protein